MRWLPNNSKNLSDDPHVLTSSSGFILHVAPIFRTACTDSALNYAPSMLEAKEEEEEEERTLMCLLIL